MKQHVMAVYDGKAGLYGQPMFTNSIGATERSFESEINRPSSLDRPNMLYEHPEDFVLYHVGTWDDNTGQFESLVPPVQIATGLNCVRKAG